MRLKHLFNVLGVVFALAVGGLVVRHFLVHGWPIHHANVWLVVLTMEIFLAAYAFKAWGWQRLFRRERRPAVVTLAAAGGAASVGGIALPGRFDELLRIAVVRRCRRPRASIGAVAFSLFVLGLIDSVALVPLASVAAGVVDVSGVGRAALIVVACSGVAAAGVVLALAVGVQFVLPYLQRVGTHPVRSRTLAAQIRALENRERVGRPVVRVSPVSKNTSAANAFSIGIGPSRTVIIWNTLLDGRFTPREVRFVVAHELGHLARHHIWKGIAWGVLFGLPIFGLVAYVTGRRGGLRRPENVPLAVFTLALAGLVVMPLANAVSRRYEAEADWMAVRATRDPGAGRALFQDFVRTDLQNPDPPGWVTFFLEDHPSALARVEQVEAWRRLRR